MYWGWVVSCHSINSLLGIFDAFVVVCWLFSKLTFSKNSFRNTFRVSNGLDPNQDRQSVGPNLGPNCLQKLLAADKNPLWQAKSELWPLPNNLFQLIAITWWWHSIISSETINSLPACGDFCRLLLKLYKQFGSRWGPTECRSCSGSKLFETLIVLNFEKVRRRQKKQEMSQTRDTCPQRNWSSIRHIWGKLAVI